MEKSPIPFRAFDEQGEIRIYQHGILPHWRQAGCTYFVTFRLADSIPQHVLLELEDRRIAWLKLGGIDCKDRNWKQRFRMLPIEQRRGYEQLIGKLLNSSLDECHGSCVLRNAQIGMIVASALEFFDGSRLLTGDYVIMPNHVHAIMTPIEGFELEDLLHSIKSYTANEINVATNGAGQVWQRESYDHIVRDSDQLQAYQNYIAGNPSKAMLNSNEYIHRRVEYYVEIS